MKCLRWLALTSILLLALDARATTVESYLRNREGVKKLESKENLQAYHAFLQALEEEPLNPEVQLNLGYTFEQNEDFEKAEQIYRGVLKIVPQDSPLRFQALFNLGGVLGKQQKIAAALDAYQGALAMQPDSKDVKTNIELLWQGGGGGGGDGQNKDKDDKGKSKNKEGDGDGKDKKQNPAPDQDQNQKQKPKPFQSQELNQQDVKKILDEIKNQEQAIRAQEYEHNSKEQGNAKDW